MKYLFALCSLLLWGCATRVEYVVVTATPAPEVGPTALECDAAWVELDPDFRVVSTVVSDLLNKTQVPNSIGETLQACISQGWRGFEYQLYTVRPKAAVDNTVSAITFDEASQETEVVARVPEGTVCFALGRGDVAFELGRVKVDTLRVQCPSVLSGQEVHMLLRDIDGTLGLFVLGE